MLVFGCFDRGLERHGIETQQSRMLMLGALQMPSQAVMAAPVGGGAFLGKDPAGASQFAPPLRKGELDGLGAGLGETDVNKRALRSHRLWPYLKPEGPD